MTRVPTVQQGGRLMVLSSGNIALAPGRGDWGPLLRRGWVETIDPDDKDKRYLPPLRITPDGLRALADAMEAHPDELLPDLRPLADRPQQLNESPAVTRLKQDVERLRKERDDAQREANWERIRVGDVVRMVMRWREADERA